MMVDFYAPTLEDVYDGLRQRYTSLPTITTPVPDWWEEFAMSADEWFALIREFSPWSEKEKAWIIEGLSLKWGGTLKRCGNN